jgi:hypothetical protein
MNKLKLIQNFLRYLSQKGISPKSLKFYKSDIASFLAWAKNEKINKNLIKRYIESQKLITPPATINRRLSTLRSFANFIQSDFMNGIENVGFAQATSQKFQVTRNAPYRGFQEWILLKTSDLRLQTFFSKLFFSRPNWYKRYHSYPLANYIHLAILVLFMSISGYGLYDQVIKTSSQTFAFPSALTRPNRYLSFQGRLTDNLGNPTTTATNMVFKLYDASTAGSELWTSGTCSITPDQDGIFSIILGSGCGTEITSTVFSENAGVWLGVTVGADAEATPRIQIATVAYALNSETLQGFPAGTGVSTIPYIDSTGKLAIAAASPTLESTSGTFAVKGQALTISTADTTNGSITINPDGTGTLDLTFEGPAAGGGANGFVNATNANITSGALYGGTVASAATGYNFIDFQSGVSPTSKFSVQDDGDIVTAGDLTLSGGNLNTGNIALTIGDATTDTITLTTDGTGNGEVLLPNDSIGPNELLSTGQTDEYCLTYETTGTTLEWQVCSAGGTMSTFTVAGDSGGGQAISDANTLSILGGTNGIDTVDSITDTVTLNLDTTEIGTTTFGSGSGITWTFNAGATDPTIAFASDAITLTAATTSLSGDLDLADDNWLGLSSGAALIEFDDQTTDEVNILNANVGIGTTTPAGTLDIKPVSGNAQIYLRPQTSGANSALEIGTGGSGNRNSYIDFVGDDTYTDYGLRLIRWNGPNANSVLQANGTGAIVIQQTSGGVQLTSGATSWSSFSDITLKNVIGGFSNALDKIGQLNPVYFTWKDDETDKTQVGLIAQDVEKVLPEAVTYSDGLLGVKYTELIPLLTAGIKELNGKFNELRESLASKIVQTNIISPIADSDLIIDLSASESAKLAIKGKDNQEVASIDADGTVNSERLRVNRDATISGTLYADNIESKRLQDIEDLLKQLLKQVEENQTLLAETSNWSTDTATESGNLVNSEQLTVNNLYVTEQAAVSSLFVSDYLTTKTINSLDTPLQIQSLAASPLEIMAGKILIDTNGNTKFLGNVEIAGNLTINNLVVATNNIDPIATESAQIVEGEINSNSTAGKAILSANTEKVRINNNKVSLNTLIYITPITSTQNKVLFVKEKGEGYFDIGFSDHLDTDVEFNWWIIELQSTEATSLQQ